MSRQSQTLALRSAIVLLAVLLGASTPSAAQQNERIYFPAVDNVRDVLLKHINAETVRIDMAAWYLTDGWIVNALLAKHANGVPIRLIGDRGSIFEIDQHTKNAFYRLANAGVPIRLRVNPTWYPEIAHWKATIFAGQNIVTFGSANYTPFELVPNSATSYKDETVLFSDDRMLVNAFKTKFDRMWNDTTREFESRISGPPYFLNWNQACARESACADYETTYPTPAEMHIDTARLEDDYPSPDAMVWGQGPSFNNRLVDAIEEEPSQVDFVIYRLTVDNITNALLAKHHQGARVRLIIEPNEYRNRKWPEFWITHANIDKLWAAGVPIKKRVHSGLTHMKMLVTSKVATNASSNFAAAWQRDHNYFVSAAEKPHIYVPMRDRFGVMWGDSAGFADFAPEPADAPTLSAPAHGVTGQSTTMTFVWNRAVFAVAYDVYLGTSQASMSKVAQVRAALVNEPPLTYSWSTTVLQPGTTYYWKIVSLTNASAKAPSTATASAIRSFTTSGTAPPPPPPDPSTAAEIVIHAADVQTAAGGWTKVADATAAGGTTLRHADAGWSSTAGPLASPANYFETTFTANAGVRYRVWLRLRAKDDSKWNDSAYVQFSDSLNGAGSPAYRIGSTSSLVENLWTCATCQSVRWGWSRHAYWLPDTGEVWFATTGSHRIRVQTREDGLDIDQIVISPATWVNSAPGPVTNDTTIVPKPGAPPPPPPPPPPTASEVVVYASDLPATALHGNWRIVTDAASPNGKALATIDNGFAATSAPIAAPADYVDVSFNADAGVPYRLWLRLRATANNKYNDAVWVQFSDALVNGSGVYRLNSSSGLLVNLATDGTASSLSAWGWQNGAYWLQQPTTFTFATAGTHTMRIQVREDGVMLDQIVLSPKTYLNAAPGPPSNDATIVPKP